MAMPMMEPMLLTRRSHAGLLAAMLLAGLAQAAAAQTPNPPAVVDSGPPLRLELHVFDGTAAVTSEVKLHLYPRGQRTSANEIQVAPGSGGGLNASVPAGYYDAQAIRERRGQVIDLRWAEQLLVQRYPDEYGRHLEMINFKPGYGGLQIRPAPSDAAAAKGWAAVAYVAGSDPAKEAGKAVPAGEDLLFALPGGRYDVKLTLGDKSTQWIRDIEVPSDRTRLKTWSAASPGAGPGAAQAAAQAAGQAR
jgi:hypothetical protein